MDIGPRSCPVKQPHVALGGTQGSGWDVGARFLEGSQQAGTTRGSLGASPLLSPPSRPFPPSTVTPCEPSFPRGSAPPFWGGLKLEGGVLLNEVLRVFRWRRKYK